MKVDSAVEHALFRLGEVAQRVRHEQPGSDVSLFRALRELHRSLSVSESADMYDPDRLIRGILFEGFAHFEQ